MTYDRIFVVLIAIVVILFVGVRISAFGAEGLKGDADDSRSLPALALKEAMKESVWRGRIEVKRENTERGTPDETTNTTLKFELFPEGTVSLLRLEVPFPDERRSFEGNPFHPRLGDIKTRVGFREVPVGDLPLFSFVEVVFPTANPESLGSGKYQLSAGLWTTMTVPVPAIMERVHKTTFNTLVQQYLSVAGDDERKDINYTKFELTLRDKWREYWMQFTVKPVVDWEQDAKTGAVAELESGKLLGRTWSAWLMLGARLWGEGVPGTYGTRATLGAAYLF